MKPQSRRGTEEFLALIDALINQKEFDINRIELFAENPSFMHLCREIINLRSICEDLSKGVLNQSYEKGGFLTSCLKELQANLRHLTWQTKRISQGDYSQKVDFLGEFSDSFNGMTIALSEARDALERAVNYDMLTGVYSRNKFFTLSEQIFEACKKDDSTLCLLMLDIDYFKSVNDKYGHLVGDVVLSAFATVIREHVCPNEIFARYGGEEFILMLPRTTLSEAIDRAHLMRIAIENMTIPQKEETIKITVSIGAAQMEQSDLKIDDLIGRADLALYMAKDKGRNRVVSL